MCSKFSRLKSVENIVDVTWMLTNTHNIPKSLDSVKLLSRFRKFSNAFYTYREPGMKAKVTTWNKRQMGGIEWWNGRTVKLRFTTTIKSCYGGIFPLSISGLETASFETFRTHNTSHQRQKDESWCYSSLLCDGSLLLQNIVETI